MEQCSWPSRYETRPKTKLYRDFRNLIFNFLIFMFYVSNKVFNFINLKMRYIKSAMATPNPNIRKNSRPNKQTEK